MATPLNAKTPYDTSLYGIGLLNAPGGPLSDAAKAAFVADVGLLLTKGNANGQGLSPEFPLPLPPADIGILVPTVNPLLLAQGQFTENLFWFAPDFPLWIPPQIDALNDPAKTPMWHQIWIDGLYQGLADMLDVPGQTPFFPIFDISAAFGVSLPIPFTLPDFAAAVGIPLIPKLLLKLISLNIAISLPLPPSLPAFPFSIPSLLVQLPPLPALPDLVLGLFKLPIDLMVKLMLPPDLGLVINLLAFQFTAVFKLAFELLLKLFPLPFPILPKVIIASLIVLIKNVISMAIVDIVCNLVGTGALAQGVAQFLGLLPKG